MENMNYPNEVIDMAKTLTDWEYELRMKEERISRWEESHEITEGY